MLLEIILKFTVIVCHKYTKGILKKLHNKTKHILINLPDMIEWLFEEGIYSTQSSSYFIAFR